MSEQILNQGSMYESIQGIQELNQVEGFDPRKYMRQLAGDGQGVKYYLDVVYRKLWFRLKYPNGKIVKKLIKILYLIFDYPHKHYTFKYFEV